MNLTLVILCNETAGCKTHCGGPPKFRYGQVGIHVNHDVHHWVIVANICTRAWNLEVAVG